ncbi:MAG: hypothetical protein LBT97_03210 [Planctomycetota bacterium]|jgi:hypothetical protein|nr:hypothetical protein [Planctomycetota bacterium]
MVELAENLVIDKVYINSTVNLECRISNAIKAGADTMEETLNILRTPLLGVRGRVRGGLKEGLMC